MTRAGSGAGAAGYGVVPARAAGRRERRSEYHDLGYRTTAYLMLLVVRIGGEPPMSIRSNPFEELERRLEAVSRQFDDASHVWESEGPLGRLTSGAESMAIDLVDRDSEFVVTVDLPGFERDDVDIRVTDHTLRIEAEHEEIHDEERERFIRHERRHESTNRSVRLPGEVDKEGVEARMRNGVLTITLPKIEVEEARRIEIEGE